MFIERDFEAYKAGFYRNVFGHNPEGNALEPVSLLLEAKQRKEPATKLRDSIAVTTANVNAIAEQGAANPPLDQVLPSARLRDIQAIERWIRQQGVHKASYERLADDFQKRTNEKLQEAATFPPGSVDRNRLEHQAQGHHEDAYRNWQWSLGVVYALENHLIGVCHEAATTQSG